MLKDGSSPSYEQLFGELDFRDDDDARSVYSPAAYLVELLGLLKETFDRPSLLERRPDLKQVLLDAPNTFTESPYLDIVNEVLERLVGDDPYQILRTRSHPFGLPFSLRSERLKKYLHYLQVAPEELYRLFASRVDHDIVARMYLGLSPEDVAVVTTVLTAELDLGACYGLAATEALADLQDVDRFTRATALTGEQLHELLRIGHDVALSPDGKRLLWRDGSTAVPSAWFEWVNRFVRLSRLTGLTMTDLDLVLTTCCAGRIDLGALRTIAVVVRLQRGHDLSAAEVCSLAVPVEPAGMEGCSGDILAARNKDYRFRLAASIEVAESDIVDIVRRYRERYKGLEPSPFDRGDIGPPTIALLRRVGRLAKALGISVAELFDVLAALESDPSLHRYTTFAVLGDAAPPTRDCYRILEGGDTSASLWLTQTLFAVVAWMQAGGFGGKELTDILGGRPEQDDSDQIAVLDNLNRAFEQVAFAPDLFVSNRFGERAAKVIHDVLTAYDDGVVSSRDDRLLRLDRSEAAAAAYDAVTDLGVIAPEDFMGLGLGERLTAKIFTNLVHLGHLQADGTLVAETTAGLRLASDFGSHGEMLFNMIGSVVNGSAAFFPSDLTTLNHLTQEQQAELYNNLIFNGYIDDQGELLQPDFFIEADNVAQFTVNADLSDVTPSVLALLDDRIARFQKDPLPLDPEIFADLRLTEPQTAALTESLRFNGHLDQDDAYRDKRSLASLRLDDFGLALEFYPNRKAILDAMQAQIADFKTDLYTFTPDDFAEIADEAMAQRVVEALDGTYTSDGRVLDETLFADPDGSLDLGTAFTSLEQDTVFGQISVVLTDQTPYRLDPSAITDLGFDDDERDQLLGLLVEAGDLDQSLAPTEDSLTYFRNLNNALDFVLPGLEDYSTDVFFLLHAVANELAAAVTEIGDLLAARAEQQRDALYGALADAFGVPAACVAAICEAVTGGPQEALDGLVAPVLTAADDTGGEVTAVPAAPHFRVAYRRVRRFALLAGKLGLDPTEVSVVFRDQDLVGKFPEDLALPPGLGRFDAILESFDGNIYLFGDGGYWVYSAATYALASPTPKALTELSARFAGLVGVDAAFTYPTGAEWIIGHDAEGASHAFTRERGSTRWAPRDQAWGKIRNNFDDPARIDAAFVDEDGRTYLFSGDQYIRYSSGDYALVDEGYPRSTTEWWEREGHGTPLPPTFRASIDACFQGRDDKIHMFTGDRWLAAGADATEQPIASRWGRVRNAFENVDRIDAAYADGSGAHLFSGNQVIRFSDSIENDGVRVDEGHPRQIRDVPPEFEGPIEAAFTDTTGVLHLFKDGRTVAMTGAGAAAVPTAERWGVLAPVLPSGTVDAAFVGLDGRTYLFSGGTYLRYSSADYAVVDLGYPRVIARDWGGLSRVDASFVLDGNTYLFGVGGLLFDLPVQHKAELDSGQLSPALRHRFLEHGLSPARVDGKAPEWHVTTEEGISLTVKQEGLRVKVYGDGARFYVRYSTKDYGTPDAGYPKPLSDNWWNLPDGLNLGPVDAVFTGRDNRTYLFAGDRFVWFDVRHRWWSEPRSLREHWDSIPFSRIDAAFVGQDGGTYVFSGPQYARYSTGDYTRIDDRYPATVSAFWGNVVNNLARTGRVDAALVMDVTETVDGVDVPRTYTYLFSGDQYVRYEGRDYAVVQDGYPRSVVSLASEPGLAGLDVTLDGVDAAFADRRTAYLFRGTRCHVVSGSPYRRYDDLGLTGVTCAFIEDGTVVAEGPEGWTRRSALEGRSATATPYRPRTLRTVPEGFRTGLDSVLNGADGNTYLFKGGSCFNVRLNREYPLTEEWGRPRNTIYQDNAVDAAFVGRDGKTYLFSDDQYVVYPDAGTTIEGDPLPINAHWGGLTSVTLAYVHGGKTYLFEKPYAAGTMRHLVYSGTDYSQPDEGYPAVTDSSFWQAPDGFPMPDAVLFEGDTMLLLSGERCVSYNEKISRWSYPRPIDRIWPGFGQGLDADDGLRAAFTAPDGATYFFFGDTYARYSDGAFSPLAPIRDRWGISRNPFVPEDGTGRVDAAFVWRGEKTYLFSGDRYVRYSGPEYRYVDAGYPKKTAGNLRQEEAFANLPESFEDALAGSIDAVIANNRNVYLLIGGSCHAVSQTVAATFELGRLGRIRNNLAERQRVDAALVAGQHTFLFSGDQYVRYSGSEYDFVDDGYPRAIGDALPDELGIPALPTELLDGIDAAFRGPDGDTYLFKGKQFLQGGAPQPALQPVSGRWGKVRNEFTDGRHAVDAAFVAPTGELYAFRSGQYIRYRPGQLDLVEEGYPRTVKDDWGDLPADFETGPDGAFVFEGRTYLLKGDQYVRYSGERYDAVDRTFPQDFRHRWSGTADYRLSDVHTIVSFVDLARSRPDGLASFLLTGAEDPYQYLSDLFGWDIDELRWARRNSGLLRVQTREEALFEIEFLLRLVDLFAVADKLGAGPSEIYASIWTKIFATTDLYRLYNSSTGDHFYTTSTAERDNAIAQYGYVSEGTAGNVFVAQQPGTTDLYRLYNSSTGDHFYTTLTAERDNAIAQYGYVSEGTACNVFGRQPEPTALYRLLERRTSPQDWRTLSAQIHNELNVLRRDALLPTVIALHPELGSSRDLFERLLIDVDMGSVGTTSRVREAIAATQLFLHRYLLDLEAVDLLAGEDADEARQRLKTWWAWMKSYRVWEANRKVFLYPENYLRPELRPHKTPAFQALEDDLLQGEITPESVQKAYKRYLDEYTEVSRLAIAGGYVYTEDGADEETRRLVLFGRTRTEPRRYYYRSAEFRDREKLSATWDPWRKVDVQIDAERVDPVHAFGRVFVFWPVVETVPPSDPANTTIVARKEGDTQNVSAPPPMHRVRIYYSFCNLNQEWVPAQVLAVDTTQDGPIVDVGLYVQASRTVPGGPPGDHDSIVVSCSYTVARPSSAATVRSAFSLTPELYGLRAEGTVAPARPADLTRIFVEPALSPIGAGQVVRFNAPADSPDGPWFSVDHKGGSFLCRPVSAPYHPAPLLPLRGNQDRLPTTWDRINAAFQLPDDTMYFFDNRAQRFIATPPDKESFHQVKQVTADRWGIIGNVLNQTGVVDAALARRDHIYLFAGDEYYRYPSRAFGTLDPGYPKKIDTNTEEPPLPRWTNVDAAFTGPDGTEYFYSRSRNGYVVSGALSRLRRLPKDLEVDDVFVSFAFSHDHLHFVFGDQYLTFNDKGDPDKDPQPLAENEDDLPEAAAGGPSFPYRDGVISFDNAAGTYVHLAPKPVGQPRPTRDLGKVPTAITRTGSVDAAYVADGKLYLTSGTEFVRYTLAADGSIPEVVDEGYPRTLARPVQGVFRRDDHRYVLSGRDYASLGTGQELDAPLAFLPVQGNWRALPVGFPQQFTGMLDGESDLFFFMGNNYAAYPTTAAIPRPYEIVALPIKIVRLTSSTAYELNRRLLTGGVEALLAPETQGTDELPAFSADISDATTIRIHPRVATAGVPTSSHLDFQSSNGIYYWEVFFHAPLLIAQALNSAQRFEDARRWYEYVFDPTERTDYWRFLPFLAIDVHALVASCRADLRELRASAVESGLDPILRSLEALAPAFQQRRELTTQEAAYLTDLAGTGLDQVKASLNALAPTEVVRSLQERVAMIGWLRRQYDLMGDRESLIEAYRDDPFDPHAIAELRPVAYRRAVVMAYIDNLLDWGDMLFRQYTAESIDEARMLYIFAYDLLGERPYDLGPRALPAATSYELVTAQPDAEDGQVDHLTAGGTLLEDAGAVHAGIANPYFYVPDNSTFFEYWTRVEDRLRKIRQSLDIMGVSRPVPLFEPAADVTALVRGAASGAALDQVTAGAAVPIPHYRFAFLFRKAQDLVDRLRQLGGDLLDALERRDAEELSLLHNRQEAAILAMTRGIKEAQLRIATEHLLEMQAARDGASARVQHYERQIAAGLSPLQEAQITMMTMGAAAHFAGGGLKIGAAVASGMPQVLLGPFIMGTEVGGEQVGTALDKGAEVSEAFGEGLSLVGELLGIRAEQERMAEDWSLQLAISRSDVKQLGYQVAGAELQVTVAQRELDILNREAANLEAVTTFLTDKFAGAQLYNWMAGRLSGIYFQTYNLAYEVARSAERAYQFERASPTARAATSSRPTGRAGATACSRARASAWTWSGWARRTSTPTAGAWRSPGTCRCSTWTRSPCWA
jgi:hypothetical protein